MPSMPRFRRMACIGAVAAGIAALLVAVPASAQAPAPQPMTAGALPAPQTDGIVFAVAIAGDTVYAGGRFSKARPAGAAPGTAEVPRSNLLAFRLSTGELLPWAPAVSGSPFGGSDPGPYCKSVGGQWVCDTVFRIKVSPDGSQVYVGGDFDKIDGKWRSRVARFAAAGGALDEGFKPVVAGRVRGISVTDDTVYLGGGFTAVNGAPRTRLGAVGLDGATRPWAPSADREVFAVLAAPAQGKVVVGGAFDTVDGAARAGLTAVDTGGGALVPWATEDPSSGKGSVITDLAADGDGNAYVSAYNYAGGESARFEGRGSLRLSDGSRNWFDGCLGDTQSLAVAKGSVYGAAHLHDCSAIDAYPDSVMPGYQYLSAVTQAAARTATHSTTIVTTGQPIPDMQPWFPNTNGGPDGSYWKMGPWSVAANDSYVVYGGEFSVVNGQPQQSLTRFAARGVPGALNRGPQPPFAKPTLRRPWGVNAVDISWKTTWDAQSSDITYQVFRDGTPDPVYTVTQRSRPWDLPTLTFRQQGVTGGTYWVRAVDADGASLGSPKATL